MKKLIIALLIMNYFTSFSQLNINAKLVKTDSIRGRVGNMNIVYESPHLVTVNDTLLTEWVISKAGSGVTIGSSTEIPYVNVTGDDFIYSNSIRFDGTNLIIPSLQSSTGVEITIDDNFVPLTTDTYNLGSPSLKWGDIQTTKINTLNWPLTDGTADQVLTTDGLGNVSFQDPQVSGNVNTYTPDLEFGGASVGMTFTTRTGSYVVTGNSVTVTVNLILSNKGSSTGTATISLPFNMADGFGGGMAAPRMTNIPFTGFCTMYRAQGTATDEVNLANMTTTGGTFLLDDGDFNNNSTLQFMITYIRE